MNYTSKYFTEQLNKFFGNKEDIDPFQLSSPQAQIDWIRRRVTRYQQKKYKFEALLPFKFYKNVTLQNNKYFLQVKLENKSVNKIFLSNLKFKMMTPTKFDLKDLNDGIFD